ncbi:hypothetical protein POM88_049943 [Heracleum sosnowskyi]|uniref:Protein FAR1-RELATED SEQUENCE n=1 Tax=Heracleum sosnowskyi TaxID=360622 RepID=A0AAD8M221_9APIA|nr:hypothetical protein POM88_049943 [Heracleum sosnowskyi]
MMMQIPNSLHKRKLRKIPLNCIQGLYFLEEIQARCGDFEIEDLDNVDGIKTYSIKDKLSKDKLFQVIVKLNTKKVECSYKLYTRVGYLCKHSFFCFTLCDIHEIPDHLLNKRWLKNAKERFSKIQIGEFNDSCAEHDIRCVQPKDCWFEFQSCIANAFGDKELIKFVYDAIKALKKKVSKLAKQKGLSKLDDGFIEITFGSNVEEITIYVTYTVELQ